MGWVLAGMAKCNSGTSSGISSGTFVQKPFQSHDSGITSIFHISRIPLQQGRGVISM